MNSPPKATLDRFLALDIHKHYLVIGGVGLRQEIVLKPRRISFHQWPEWAMANLRATDAVVLESTTNAWHVHDQVALLVGRTVVAHPALVKVIATARVKTDPRAVLDLARLLAANLVPEVWVPPLEVRELRALVNHRRRLVKLRTMTCNRLHSLLHQHNVPPPSGDIFSSRHRAWWNDLHLSSTQSLRARQDLATLDHLEPQIAEVEAELNRLSTVHPWAAQAAYLIQLPGIGALSAMTILAAIGDITRFPTPKKLVGYAGLGACVHDSGQTHRGGRITKQGRKDLRWIMVQAAWTAVGHHPLWKDRYLNLAHRIGWRRAIVAMARKLLVVVWHVLTQKVADRHADDERVASKLMAWARMLDPQERDGLTTPQFVRYHLLQLGLGHTLPHIRQGSRTCRLASPQEVLAIKPDLGSAA